jgi:hypothetical protein
VTHVLRAVYLGFCLFFAASPLPAAVDPGRAALAAELPRLSSGATASLITYSPGEELYQAFGHSAIRIKDDSLGMDRLYNYGTFDFDTPDFYLKFAHGDLLYQLSVTPANEEIQMVGANRQGVTELMLNLSLDQKQQLFEALEYNLLPENRFYRYDFIFDNCSTRPRDVLEQVFGAPIVEKEAGALTFRQMLNPYFVRMPWIGFGLSLLMGANVDRIAGPREACFLPADLERAVEEAGNGNQKLTTERRVIFEPKPLPRTPLLLSPFSVFAIGGAAWFLFWLLRRRGHTDWPTAALFFVFGATGSFLLAFSVWSRLKVLQINYNIAWLVPTHVLAGVWLLIFRRSWTPLRWYFVFAAFVGLVFIPVSLLLPQEYNLAIYPLIALVVWRSSVEFMSGRISVRE